MCSTKTDVLNTIDASVGKSLGELVRSAPDNAGRIMQLLGVHHRDLQEMIAGRTRLSASQMICLMREFSIRASYFYQHA